ncbi:myelin-associated glycoprotein [Syngnathus scovelli]|uniref:myelin-associated glycoprotein n=1 Tax=Syngnathus scovelli TaxID=161590 RepID=UPI00210FE118|nr:myelin-associated glycoprotein [Syngnathus scovelli]
MDYLQPLIEFTVIVLFLAAHSKGETWGLQVNRTVTAVMGQSVTIPCTFSYPPYQHTRNIRLFWKLTEKSTFNTYDRDRYAFIYHPNSTFVVERYQGKTSLLGKKSDKSCTLRIQKLMESPLVIFLRIIAKNDSYSFYKQRVLIVASDAASVTLNPGIISITSAFPDGQQSLINRDKWQTIYVYIFVPLVAVGIILAAGFLVWKKHKRSQSFLRAGSGHYANFSRASPNPPTRKENRNIQDNKNLPDGNVVEEPVYVNVQRAACQMDERGGDHSIYENVAYMTK